jgi:hypothetical protein
MSTLLAEELRELHRLLQEGEVAQAQAAILRLIPQAETGATLQIPETATTSHGRVDRWLGRFLDAEHNLLLSRIGEASESDVRELDRHIEARRELLELALQAGDWAEEMARTYELLGGSADEGGLAKGVMRELA